MAWHEEAHCFRVAESGDFFVEQEVSHGSFGVVRKGLYGGEHVAVKTHHAFVFPRRYDLIVSEQDRLDRGIPPEQAAQEEADNQCGVIDEMRRKISALAELNHPNILKLLAVGVGPLTCRRGQVPVPQVRPNTSLPHEIPH
jgi:hypothetical protein